MSVKTPQSRILLAIIPLSIILLTLLVIILVLNSAPKAELILTIAPRDAEITLDGNKISTGAQKIHPGQHHLKISHALLQDKEFDFEISENETKSYNEFLLGDKDSLNFYLNDEENIRLLSLMDDEKAADFLNKYNQAATITELLPITIAHEKGSKTSILSLKTDDCTRTYCLLLTDDNAELKSEMYARMKELGYNPDDYEIIYERTDSLKEKIEKKTDDLDDWDEYEEEDE